MVSEAGKEGRVLEALNWRCIGPFRGGRVVAVAGDPADLGTFYFGACAGGVWKTTDGGTYWRNVSDGYFKTAAVGALAVADSDPNVVYAGMGESCIRGDVSHGDGVYGSTDGGKSWAHLGLADARYIARVDPEVVVVPVGRGELGEGPPAVDRFPGLDVQHVHRLGVLGIGEHVAVVPGP